MPPGHALRSVSSRWVWHREHPPKHQPKITVRGSPSAIPYFSTTLWRIMMFTQTAQKYETTHIMISSWFVVPSAAFHWRDSAHHGQRQVSRHCMVSMKHPQSGVPQFPDISSLVACSFFPPSKVGGHFTLHSAKQCQSVRKIRLEGRQGEEGRSEGCGLETGEALKN